MLYINTNFLKTSKNYTNTLVNVTTSDKIKDILEADMLSTNEGFSENSPIYPMTLTPVKKPIALK